MSISNTPDGKSVVMGMAFDNAQAARQFYAIAQEADRNYLLRLKMLNNITIRSYLDSVCSEACRYVKIGKPKEVHSFRIEFGWARDYLWQTWLRLLPEYRIIDFIPQGRMLWFDKDIALGLFPDEEAYGQVLATLRAGKEACT